MTRKVTFIPNFNRPFAFRPKGDMRPYGHEILAKAIEDHSATALFVTKQMQYVMYFMSPPLAISSEKRHDGPPQLTYMGRPLYRATSPKSDFDPAASIYLLTGEITDDMDELLKHSSIDDVLKMPQLVAVVTGITSQLGSFHEHA